MSHRNYRQIRAIKNYAQAMQLELELAAQRWCETGLAAQWARGNW